MSRRFEHGAAWVAVVGGMGIVAAGCLTRPVVSHDPVTFDIFKAVVENHSIDKLDILFMIDNSASMGDKQALLALAVPDMITRLVQPLCVDASGNPTGGNANPDGTGCAIGKPEFPPVHNMHLGVITSSLGGRGGNACPTTGPTSMNPVNNSLSNHDDDQAHLINRGGNPTDPTVENTVTDATSPDNFLSWFPSVPANMGMAGPPGGDTAITQVGAPGMTGTFIGDFTQMMAGVHEHGCGFEAQNEAWYRFLIQPDPFQSITKDMKGHASFSGIDDVVLKERADFLRPDSLVAVIVVTDENEEVVDPLTVNGLGWLYENTGFPGGPGPAPEGTTECNQPVDPNNATTTGPYGPNCTSCGFDTTKADPNFATRCPNNAPSGTNGYLDSSNDAINVRFFHQKQRFGLFSGYPLGRYIRGLTKEAVPDSNHEHDRNSGYVADPYPDLSDPAAQSSAVAAADGAANCVNPLYAQNLPTGSGQELCNLTRGPRTQDLVYYAAIAGVPHQLLQAQVGDPECPQGTNQADCPQKSTLSPDDWLKITGADPEHYNFTGADFHMIESETDRTNNTGNWANASSCPSNNNNPAGNDCDPINGREWNTNNGDLELACRFDIRPQYGGQGKDCSSNRYTDACDCQTGNMILNNVLCDKNVPTLQIYGKAYPSVREMEIAHAMSNVNAMSGGQGIVSSLCPIHVTEQTPGDPVYGYRPAVNAIVDRLKQKLNNQCVAQKLVADKQCGNFPCLLLVSLNKNVQSGNKTACKNPGSACNQPGLQAPQGADVDVVSNYCDEQEAQWQKSMAGPEPYTVPVCEMRQLFLAPTGGQASGCPAPAPAGDFTPSSGNTPVPGDSCAGSPEQGWCYVTGVAAGPCGHSVLFTTAEPPSGASVSLQCIEQAVTAIDGG
jgi:hypothetical protein